MSDKATSSLAPVVLFVYNRPEHTRKTVTALQQNHLASQSDLIIYSDAAKVATDQPGVDAVRAYAAAVTGFRSVTVIPRRENYGLARSIIEGVTDVINRYGRVIVLEDDLVTSPSFLAFMNQALEFYRDDSRVMNVNGYVLPVEPPREGNVFFIRIPSSWGWATWARSWQFFRRDAQGIMDTFTVRQRHEFDFGSVFPFFRTVVRNYRGQLDTWAIFWYAVIFGRHGLCVAPGQSLVRNIGNDGSGTHSKKNAIHDGELAPAGFLPVFSDKVDESRDMVEKYRRFYRTRPQGILTWSYLLLLRTSRQLLLACGRCTGLRMDHGRNNP